MNALLTRVFVIFACTALPLFPIGDCEAASVPTAKPEKNVLESLEKASWIWHADSEPLCHFRKVFVLKARPKSAVVWITADNGYELLVNGSLVGSDSGFDAAYWKSVERYDVARLLITGTNVIAVRATDAGGQAGFVAALRLSGGKQPVREIVTDRSWRVTKNSDPTGYTKPEFAENAEWQDSRELGRMGIEPWGKLTFPQPVSPAHATAAAARNLSVPDEKFCWPDGIVFVRGHAPESSTPGAPQAIWRIGNSRAYLELDTLGPAMAGRSLWSLAPARPDGELKLLLDAGRGLVGSPSVSFDGSEIFFSMVREGEKFFHICRIPARGGAVEALTSGPFHDFDPEPLPDGRIVFSSTRVGHREEYHGNSARALFVMNCDGSGIRQITHHIVGDNEPRLTAAGQIAFIRQDNFMERAKVETHVHAVRPDGTAGQVLLGPDREPVGYGRASAAETDARWLRSYGFGSIAPLPDGRVAALSAYGLVISGNAVQPPASVKPAVELIDISPLPDGRLLCATAGFGIGILEPDTGKVFPIYQKDAAQVHSAVNLAPRPAPTLARSSVPPITKRRTNNSGFLLGRNVFYSKQNNADMSRVRAIRVIEGIPFTTRSARHPYAHLGVEAVELGTTPLAPDGSFYIEVPADRALALQAVDGEGRSVVNELSWIYVRPGEQRSCVGCHSQRESAPPNHADILALRAPAVRLLGQGQPHRFRGNNAANGGVLNLQFDRFREAASINLHVQQYFIVDQRTPGALATRAGEVHALLTDLSEGDAEQKISAAQRLAVFRNRRAAAELAKALSDSDAAVRMNAALALATCGTRETVPLLLDALDDRDCATAQAAHVALRNLTAHDAPFNGFEKMPGRKSRGADWRAWFSTNNWETIERGLIARLQSSNPAETQDSIVALGHVAGESGKEALRAFIERQGEEDLRAALAAMRSLGHLRDTNAIPLLARMLAENIGRKNIKAEGSHEFGWLQRPVQIAAGAAEALGWIDTREAERALLDAAGRLEEFFYYTLQNGDHEWLKGCHSSLPHYRTLEALDAMGSRNTVHLVPLMLRSVPIDTDRALLFENDSYETLTARVANRAGTAQQIIETCLAVLGDARSIAAPELKEAVTNSPPAVSVGPLDPESRAAQLLSIVCLDRGLAPRIRQAFERYRAHAPSRTRSWVCFYLARTLGKLQDAGAVDALVAALEKDLTEASFGLVDAPNVFFEHAMTPCYRAAAAYALGEIGERRATRALFDAVSNFENAMDVRNAAARSLAKLVDRDTLPELQRLATDYPETATRRVLLSACEALAADSEPAGSVARSQ